MIDFHTHLLYGIDDGVRAKEDSLKALAEYKEAGIFGLVFTPHLYNPYVTTRVERIRSVFSDLHQEALKMGIQTYLGAELFVGRQKLKTIPAMGRYALCEFDIYNQTLGFCDLIDEALVKEKGYEIIIAHVERYKWLTPGGEKALDMKKRGYLFQMNAESVTRGLSPRAKKWLESNMIDLFSTDNHGRTKGLPLALKEACRAWPEVAEKMVEIENGIL